MKAGALQDVRAEEDVWSRLDPDDVDTVRNVLVLLLIWFGFPNCSLFSSSCMLSDCIEAGWSLFVLIRFRLVCRRGRISVRRCVDVRR